MTNGGRAMNGAIALGPQARAGMLGLDQIPQRAAAHSSPNASTAPARPFPQRRGVFFAAGSSPRRSATRLERATGRRFGVGPFLQISFARRKPPSNPPRESANARPSVRFVSFAHVPNMERCSEKIRVQLPAKVSGA